jgi:UDP-glucose 4-epimerase
VSIWITGGAGFLGSHLVDAVSAQSQKLSVIDDFSSGFGANLAKSVTTHRINLCDPQLGELLRREQPELIYHLAGDGLATRSIADPVADCDRNLLPTLHLLEAIRTQSPRSKLLFASTGAVYGEHAAKPFVETDGLTPATPYAVAKLASESYCHAYARTYGLATCSLRLFSVYGPRQRKQVVYDMIRKLHAATGEVEVFGDGTQERDFNHCANVVDAFLLAAAKAPFQGEAFNVAGGEVVTIRELVARLCAAMGKALAIRFTGQRAGDSQRWVADTSALRALGYLPRLPLTEGLHDTIDWYLSNPA